jgi:hypothetical protein
MLNAGTTMEVDMDILTILLVVIALLAIGAGGWALARMQQRRRLSGRFGPEYDRTVHELGGRSEAEHELARREQRVALLEIRPLAAEERSRYAAEWKRIQARFVDAPEQAVADADRLIADAMQRRGYPLGDFERRSADLSVDHPEVVQHYRAGRDLAERSRAGEADTEDLRQAMVHYRALFAELLQPPAEPRERRPA